MYLRWTNDPFMRYVPDMNSASEPLEWVWMRTLFYFEAYVFLPSCLFCRKSKKDRQPTEPLSPVQPLPKSRVCSRDVRNVQWYVPTLYYISFSLVHLLGPFPPPPVIQIPKPYTRS